MNRFFAIIVLFLISINFCFAENEKPEAEIPAQLQKDGILITQKTYKQIFDAYLDDSRPFITTDSCLNAFHVLYEESIFRLENRQADVLEAMVDDLYQSLLSPKAYDSFRFPREETSKAMRRAKLVLGVAKKIYHPEFVINDPELEKDACLEISRINQGSGIFFPKWLGEPTAAFAGIDYSRFKPRGFYQRNDKLEKYFKATAWLQAIPFMVNRDDDLLSFLILSDSFYKLCQDYAERQRYFLFFKVYDVLLGKPDGQGIHNDFCNRNLYRKDELLSFRKELESRNAPQINDSLRGEKLPGKGIQELRILPARATPDAILFTLTTAPELNRAVPDGLEICALLGSKFARKQLPPQLLEIIEKQRNIANQDNCYSSYLHLLQSLFETGFANAPDFMRTTPWEIKSCNTALAGWAQLRHTWILQAKENVNYLGAAGSAPGFVEPNVAFWGRLAALAEKTQAILAATRCFEQSLKEDILSYQKLAELFEKEEIRTIIENHPELLEYLETAISAAFLINPNIRNEENEPEWRKLIAKALHQLTDLIKNNELEQYPKLESLLSNRRTNLRELWTLLNNTCLKLQVLSLKQLYHIERSESETRFIADYGAILAKIMLYDGNSYLTPNDDAPRITDVFCDTVTNGQFRYLEVGISRPREILVLYPTPEGKVLCKGAVMPYYEFFSNTRLNDNEWQTMLDDKSKRPKIPSWLAPITENGALSVPEKTKSGH